jgi:phosphoglycerol transferase MdoB-like AlkP superfamily enzyme
MHPIPASRPNFSPFVSPLARLTLWAGPYAVLLQMLMIGLVLLSLSRIGLMVWQWERVSATGIVADMLIQGMRADLILLGYFLAFPLLAAPLFAHRYAERQWKLVTATFATCSLVFILFMELSTPQFIMQFDVRPNRLFIEYLSYPKEVFSTLWHGFRIALVLGVGATIVASLGIYLLLKSASANAHMWSSKKVLLTWPPPPPIVPPIRPCSRSAATPWSIR